MSVRVHSLRRNVEHDRSTVAPADLDGHGVIGREMHMVAVAAYETSGADGVEKPIRGPVVEDIRRSDWLVGEVDVDRMALIGADALAIFAEGESLLVAFGDEALEQRPRERNARCVATAEQRLHLDPTRRIQREAGFLRLVPKHETEEFTETNVIGHDV